MLWLKLVLVIMVVNYNCVNVGYSTATKRAAGVALGTAAAFMF